MRILILCSLLTCIFIVFNGWGSICSTGKSQSPVALTTYNTQLCVSSKFKINLMNTSSVLTPLQNSPGSNTNLVTLYTSSTLTITDNNGLLLQYSSAQYHMHIFSQHTLDGVQGDLEIHIVHKLLSNFTNQRNLAVVGLMFKVDDSANSTMFENIDFTTNASANLNLTFSPEIINQKIFHYQGSLTTPPCTEAVNWYVINKIFPIRTVELNRIQSVLWAGGHNNRPVQPLNGRVVKMIDPNCMNNVSGKITLLMMWEQKVFLIATLIMFLIM